MKLYHVFMLFGLLCPMLGVAGEGRTYSRLEMALESPGNAKALKLNGQNIEAPGRISTLSGLEVLQLKNCGLTELPAGIGNLKKLRLLVLSGNQIKALPPELAGLTSLEFLYLEDNRITKIPDVLARLPSLKAVYLSGNRIEDVPERLADVPTLKLVTLGGNPVASNKALRNRTSRVLAGVLVTY